MKRIAVVRVELVKEKNLLVDNKRITTPEAAYEILRKYLGNPDREHFVLMCLNTKNEVTHIHTVAIGTLNAAPIHPRELFKTAILANSAAIIIAHNHPSGDPTPSQQDIEITKRLDEAGEILGINILDHIICGSETFTSFKAKGLL